MLKNHRYYPVVRIPSCHDQGRKVIASFFVIRFGSYKILSYFFLVGHNSPCWYIFWSLTSHLNILWKTTRCSVLPLTPIHQVFHGSIPPSLNSSTVPPRHARWPGSHPPSGATRPRPSAARRPCRAPRGWKNWNAGHMFGTFWGTLLGEKKWPNKLGPMASLVFPFEDKPHAVRTCRKWWLEPDGLYLNMNPARMLKKNIYSNHFSPETFDNPELCWMDLLAFLCFFNPSMKTDPTNDGAVMIQEFASSLAKELSSPQRPSRRWPPSRLHCPPAASFQNWVDL